VAGQSSRPRAALNFVGDHQSAVLRGESARAIQKTSLTERCRFALNRFQKNGADGVIKSRFQIRRHSLSGRIRHQESPGKRSDIFSVEVMLIAPKVRPWNEFSSARKRCCFAAVPGASSGLRAKSLASFIAPSMASVPLWRRRPGRDRTKRRVCGQAGPGARCDRDSRDEIARRPRGGLLSRFADARDEGVTAMPPRKSRYFFPVASKT